MGVGGLTAAAVRLSLLPLEHVALLGLLDLARRGKVRLLELRAQLSLGRGQLALAPEVHKVVVHAHVECGRVRVHGLGGVVLLLAEKEDLVLGGERFEFGQAVGPAVFQFSHGDSLSVGKSGEVGFHLVAVCHRVHRVVAVDLLAVGGFVLGDLDNPCVAIEGALDQRRVLLELEREGKVVEDVGECGAIREAVLEVSHSVDHVGHDFGSGFGASFGARRWDRGLTRGS